MRGHLPGRGGIGVQQPGRAPMGAVPTAAIQRRLQRITDHRVHEPRAVAGREHFGPDQLRGQPHGDGHGHPRDRGRVPQRAAIP